MLRRCFRLMLVLTSSALLSACVSVAPQITDLRSAPADQAVIVGRLVGENSGYWMGMSRVMIYFHKYSSVDDIPRIYIGLADHVRADVKNDSGVFVAALPPGRYYVSGFHYGATHIEYTRRSSEASRFAVLDAKPGVTTYIGSFLVGDWKKSTSKSNFISTRTQIENECADATPLLKRVHPQFEGRVECGLVSLEPRVP